MNLDHMPVQLRTNGVIRIDARAFIVGPPSDQGRVFTDKQSGTEKPFSDHAIAHMVRSGRITTDAAYRALDPHVVANTQVDWGAFSDLERKSAQRRYPFVAAIDALPIMRRDKKKYVEPVIVDLVTKLSEDDRPKTVNFRLAREWYRRWLVTGRDIRALIANHRKKGNRTGRYEDWLMQEVSDGILETYKASPHTTLEVALRRVNARIVLRAEREGRALPNLAMHPERCIGKHLVTRMIANMELYDLTKARHGKHAADFLLKAVRAGPTCNYPLEEAEVDHTPLDLEVVDDNGRNLSRPYLTTISDRRTRMILGFSLSFTPPSWVSVMEALRHAVQPKEAFMEEVSHAIGLEPNFKNRWLCYGACSRLFVDNGPEFRSKSMTAAAQALNIQMVDLKRGQPHLKGRIERWFRTINDDLIHTAPGTTKSNIKAKGKYNSRQEACLTLKQVTWLITKWIVDVYHVKINRMTQETPLDRWTREIRDVGERPPPPSDLLVAMTGKVIQRKLGPNGIYYKDLRWQSDDFSALRNRINDDGYDVTVRIDPFDLAFAYVLDPTESDLRKAWVVGELQTGDEVRRMTLHQYETVRKAARSEIVEHVDPKKLLDSAQTNQEIFDVLNGSRKSTLKMSKRVARFVTDGRNDSQHIRPDRIDPAESAEELTGHDWHADDVKSNPPDERGPYRDEHPEISPPPSTARIPSPSLDASAVEAATPKISSERARLPNPFVTPLDEPIEEQIVVKRRNLD
ncbi:DDE-type integrase/transposase/recombinase [Tardiphaga robiniae]|uniref:DDE-type integrase/transposase/recombinase n=1 Tax=Tardiphaga robiniae TaxID=943830 RepID=UPI0015864337|nr:DDE-type integrase/transposase/recombinase [Tardiphaga robiniae]NUU44502.1 transposase family protein [Tardiphaga robiniae]